MWFLGCFLSGWAFVVFVLKKNQPLKFSLKMHDLTYLHLTETLPHTLQNTFLHIQLEYLICSLFSLQASLLFVP